MSKMRKDNLEGRVWISRPVLDIKKFKAKIFVFKKSGAFAICGIDSGFREYFETIGEAKKWAVDTAKMFGIKLGTLTKKKRERTV
jgi:hypothetical protein